MSVATLSECTFAHTRLTGSGDRQHFSTVDPSELRRLGLVRRHVRRGAVPLLEQRGSQIPKDCAAKNERGFYVWTVGLPFPS